MSKTAAKDSKAEKKETRRELHGHSVAGSGEPIKVYATDEPSHGGANHEYDIVSVSEDGKDGKSLGKISFQNGPVGEEGVNGVTHEALLLVVKDRLENFNLGGSRSLENAQAIRGISDAIDALNRRTAQRMRLGIEGTSAVRVEEQRDGVQVTPEDADKINPNTVEKITIAGNVNESVTAVPELGKATGSRNPTAP